MPVGRPENPVFVVSQRLFTRAVGVDDVKLQMVLFLAVAAEDHLLAVGRKERAAVVATRRLGELASVLAVGVHDEQFEILWTGAVRAENDLLAIGRIGTLGVVARRVGEALEAGSVEIRFENVHVRIEIPHVPAALLGFLFFLAKIPLGGIVLFGVGIEMAAGEDDFRAVGMEVAAGRLADAGADAARGAGLQVHHELLVERVLALLLGLENDRAAI